MSTDTYPHRSTNIPGLAVKWECRCGALPTVYGADAITKGWGRDCPAALREALDGAKKAIAVLQEAVDIHVQNHLAQQAEISEERERADTMDAEATRLSGLYRKQGAELAENRRMLDVIRHDLLLSGIKSCHPCPEEDGDDSEMIEWVSTPGMVTAAIARMESAETERSAFAARVAELERARDAERAAVVAWLRECAEHGMVTGNGRTAITLAADVIARVEHLNPEDDR